MKCILEYFSSFYLCDEKWSICKRLNFLHLEGIKDPLVFGPGDELEGWMRLDMAVNDAT